MCLITKKTKKVRQKYINNRIDKHRYITVYKIVMYRDDCYRPPLLTQCDAYAKGINKADTSKRIGIWQCSCRYKSGFHFYVSKKRVIQIFKQIHSFLYGDRIIECQVREDWITEVGNDGYSGGDTIIAHTAIFPSFKNDKWVVKSRVRGSYFKLMYDNRGNAILV